MRRRKERWSRLVGRVGSASYELLVAEVRGIADELAQSGRRLGRLAAIAGLAFGVFFWGLGALLTAAVAGMSLLLPLWAAALLIAVVLFVLSTVLCFVVRARVRALETPLAAVNRRVDEHLDWWQREVVGETPPTAASATKPEELL